MTSPSRNATLKIAFRPADETFEVADAAIDRDAEFISDITSLWRDSLPNQLFVSSSEELHRRPTLNSLVKGNKDELEGALTGCVDLSRFRFQVIELSAETDEEQVAEIFVESIPKRSATIRRTSFER